MPTRTYFRRPQPCWLPLVFILCVVWPVLAFPALAQNAGAVNGNQAGSQNGTGGNSAEQAVVVVAPPPLSLPACIKIGLSHQPAIAGARASLAAAIAGEQALYHLPHYAYRLARDIPVRQQQAHLGVVINQGVVAQSEWETIYSITRNYFSVQYARKQTQLTRGLVRKLKDYKDKAQLLIGQGDPDTRVTTADVDKLAVNIELYQLKVIEAEQGELRALVALREAMGLEAGCPLILQEELPLLQAVPCQADLLALALSRRGEMIQANNAAQLLWLEVQAQCLIRSVRAMTFAAGSDIHARPVPTADFTDTYRPAALGPEMPPYLIGRSEDRVQRAQEFAVRAGAVVAKTQQLITLEMATAYLRWQEAARKLQTLQETPQKAAKVLKITEDRFEIGGVSGEEMLRTKLLAEQVQAEQNIAAYMHALALASLERITAGGFVPAYRLAPGPRLPAAAPPSNGNR